MNNQNNIAQHQTICPLCNVTVNRKNLDDHMAFKCPQRPGYHAGKLRVRKARTSNVRPYKKRIFRDYSPIYYHPAARYFMPES
jgi:hypothetical protein